MLKFMLLPKYRVWTYRNVKIYIGASLSIPASLAYDIVPPSLEPNDFKITTQLLNEFNVDDWGGLT